MVDIGLLSFSDGLKLSFSNSFLLRLVLFITANPVGLVLREGRREKEGGDVKEEYGRI